MACCVLIAGAIAGLLALRRWAIGSTAEDDPRAWHLPASRSDD
jgi:hypothetical protein